MGNIFSYNLDINKNAYLNWDMDYNNDSSDLKVMADGFALAAERLMNNVFADNRDKKADILIFPILFSAYHSIELYLKAILYKIDQIQGNRKIHKGHDIKKLLEEMEKQIKK